MISATDHLPGAGLRAISALLFPFTSEESFAGVAVSTSRGGWPPSVAKMRAVYCCGVSGIWLL